jgi:hypothetical protein
MFNVCPPASSWASLLSSTTVAEASVVLGSVATK